MNKSIIEKLQSPDFKTALVEAVEEYIQGDNVYYNCVGADDLRVHIKKIYCGTVVIIPLTEEHGEKFKVLYYDDETTESILSKELSTKD